MGELGRSERPGVDRLPQKGGWEQTSTHPAILGGQSKEQPGR